MKYKVILLYVLILFFFSCGPSKGVVEKVVIKDSIAYALPGESRISLSALCDTISKPVILFKNGPVRTEVKTIKGDRQLVVQYDTIYKEKIVTRDVSKTEYKDVPYIPKWFRVLFWIFVGYSVTVTFFPNVAKAVNVIIKKIIRFPV